MKNIRIYTLLDGHVINFSGATNITNNESMLIFDTNKNRHYVFYKASIMGFCIEEEEVR